MSTKKSDNQQQTAESARPIEELFLLHLRYKEAQLIETGNNQPILLNDKNTTWVVYAGRVDIFAVPLTGGRATGQRTHLFRVGAGQAVWGMDFEQAGGRVGLLAIGNKDTSLLKLPVNRLQTLSQDEEYSTQIISLLDQWVKKLSTCLAYTLPPKDCLNLEVGRETIVAPQTYASAKGNIVWIEHIQGNSYFLGRPEMAVNGKGFTPLSADTWIETIEDCRIQAQDTAVFLTKDPKWIALDSFHQLLLQNIEQTMAQMAKADQARLQNRITANQAVINEALSNLAAPLVNEDARPLTNHGQNHLLKVCQLVADNLNITLVEPPAKRPAATEREALLEVSRASRFQIRQVVLKGEWWRSDSGPFLGYWGESKQPVAILPQSATSYVVHDPVQGTQTAVDQEIMEHLSPFAIQFYRPFSSQAVSAWEMLKFGLQGRQRELRTILLAGISVSILSLMIPIATGFIFDTVIPNAARSQLLQIGLVMFVIALAMATFQITQNIAVLRLQGKMGNDIQAAVWSRLISLPVSFFRDYTAGDLGNRAMGINVIYQTLSGPIMYALLSGLFSIFNFLLLFYYSRLLALIAMALVLMAVTVTVICGSKQVRYQRSLIEIQGGISGSVLQAISGITKFRTSGSEGHAFANWARDFSKLKETAYKSRNVANNLVVFNAGFMILATMIIFAIVVMLGQDALSTGQFLAFYAAFAQFFAAVLTLNTALISVLGIVPLYERAQPILQTQPEIDELKEYPGELTGQIEVSHVSFRYHEDGPEILRDVSLDVKPGEFVALVGPSGSGKSTLFRLLIGFEQTPVGNIYYDGQDLNKIDIRETRRQMGVVLQDGKLMAGDIFTNIIGASLLTLDDAWEAAKMAGLAEDIKAMPMGMYTMVSAGGSTLSGGQKQRLLIARALVNKPRIIFFDEATSALDSHTQAIVSESLENLKATRIVIAHRLSTIMNADRIYVLQNGRLVQQGTYDAMIKEEGPFLELAKRQMV